MEKKYLCIDVGGTSINMLCLTTNSSFRSGAVSSHLMRDRTYLNTLGAIFGCKRKRAGDFRNRHVGSRND